MVANQTELFFQFLGNSTVEIRSLRHEGPPKSEFAYDTEQFVDLVESKNGEFSGVYCTLNPIREGVHRSVGDSDIDRLTTVFIDIDPVRPTGKAATELQHGMALKKARDIASFLTAQGIYCIQADSGNGAYVFFKIDLAVEDAYLIRELLETLDAFFSNEQVKVDRCVHNPSRICRIPGTMNRKAKPYRKCKLLTDDICVPVASKEQLEKLICHELVDVPKSIKPKVQSLKKVSLDELNARESRLIEYMRRHGCECIKKARTRDGGRILLYFDKCPAHSVCHGDNKNGKLVIHGDGSIGFVCHHDDHHAVTWKDIQDRFDETFKDDILRDYNDPERLAKVHLESTMEDGVYTICSDGKVVYQYSDGQWLETTDRANQCCLRPTIVEEYEKFAASRRQRPAHINSAIVANTYSAILSSSYRPTRPEVFAPYWLSTDDWDAADILPVSNGIINIRAYCEGEAFFRPPTAKLFTTSVSAVEYDPDAQCSEFEAFLKSLERDEVWYALLQQLFAYTLWLAYSLQKYAILVGPGGSGKGLLMAILRLLCGGSFASLKLSNLSDSDNHGLQGCPGKRLIYVPEARMPTKDASQIVDAFKAITGGDPVRINPKHQAPYTCPIQGTIWIAANRFNKMPDASNAINRRMIPLQFSKSWDGRDGNPEPDPNLQAKLTSELSGILNWVLKGAKALYDNNGQFVLPESSVDLLNEAMTESSPLRDFFNDKCEIDAGSCVRTTSVYRAYKEWSGDRCMPESEFLRQFVEASGFRVQKHRMSTADARRVKGCELQEAKYDSSGRSHVFLNLKIIEQGKKHGDA